MSSHMWTCAAPRIQKRWCPEACKPVTWGPALPGSTGKAPQESPVWPQGSLGRGNAVTTDPKSHTASCEMKDVLAKADLVQRLQALGLSWVSSVGEDGSWFVTELGFCM